MNKQEMQLAIVRKGNEVVEIGRSQVLQPKIKFSGGNIKWLDDELYKKKAGNES